MNSCLYEGTIRHRRFRPVANAFRYRLFLMYLDLDELEAVAALHPLLSIDRFNYASFRRQDHLGDPQTPLKQALAAEVQRQIGVVPEGPVRVITHLRYFGYVFNPVSFYFCYDRAGAGVETIVAEVHNTPWGEEHIYVMGKAADEHPLRDWRRHRFSKAFHVSPFMDMELDYDWRFRLPGPRLNAHAIVAQKGRPLFEATLSLARRPLTKRSLTRVWCRHPFMTGKVIAAIHWQALRLYTKGAPFYTHPEKRGAALHDGENP
jgi:DUF1365 family protein